MNNKKKDTWNMGYTLAVITILVMIILAVLFSPTIIILPPEPTTESATTLYSTESPSETEVSIEDKTTGKYEFDNSVLFLQDLEWFTGHNLSTISSTTDNMGNTRMNVINDSWINNVYKINGKFSRIDGYLFQDYSNRNETRGSTLEIYGDGKLLDTFSMKGGIEPLPFNVKLSGVLELHIIFDNSAEFNRNTGGRLSDVALWE